ncbi:class I SAM-dependent methyltransferase [Haladaptatus sp. DYF46]|uniref:class I SAM-dependent methyltransferase n=1 Tax=Haladaptatus sp. DYF46 TaxID=2886041 RepID=UPI001E3D2E4E|nr:class I SAM-dependent methyltransferase [Haladaptatus sp. DYF46]
MNDANRFSDEVAAFYDASHEYGDIGDESFYLEAAMGADGPVLEGACGAGRLYLELLRRGVDADGFDVSPAMLDILRKKAATEDMEPTVWEADLRSIGAERIYSLAIVPYNSFCNLRGVDDQLAALEALYGVLNSGGRLLFDVYVPRYDTIAESFGEWQSVREVEYEGRQLRGRSRATIEDQVKQTYRAEQELVDSDGDVLTRDEFVLSHLPPQQVELLARHSPFDRWSVSGGFDGESLTDGDGVQVWELVK